MKNSRNKANKGFLTSPAIIIIQLQTLSMTGQPCDVTFYKRRPALDVKIDSAISKALIQGANTQQLREMMDQIQLSNGDVISIHDIWTINSMPKEGVPKEAIETVDMSDADIPAGPNGETIREMIRATYFCKTKEEEDYYVRRYLAS